MKVFCILSDERAFRSRSPAMHTRVLKRVGIDGMYVPFRVHSSLLSNAVSGLKALNVAGANVTVPYKEAVMPYLDRIDKEAEAIAAVNTIVWESDQLVGYNTDAAGFSDSLAAGGFSASGGRAVVFGTGGAAKAIVFALGQLGLEEITVVGRNMARAEELARRFGCKAGALDSLSGLRSALQLLVNATSVSAEAEAPEFAGLVNQVRLEGCELVVDLNYARTDNFWQQMARNAGVRFIDGLPMLAHQARRSFTLWTGLDVDPELFLEALEEIS